MGLPREVGNLVILAFAEQTGRSFYLDGRPEEGTLAGLSDRLELREWKGPPPRDWDTAVQRAESIFCVSVSPLLKPTNVTALATQVREKAAGHRAGCQELVHQLREALQRVGRTDAARLQTAAATVALLDRLAATDGDGAVSAVAGAEVATSEAAMSGCLTAAAEWCAAIKGLNWELVDGVSRLPDARKEEGAKLADQIADALSADEHAVPLLPVLKEAQAKAVRLLTTAALPHPLVVTKVPHSPPKKGAKSVRSGERVELTLAEAVEALEQLKAEQAAGGTVTVSLAWSIEGGGTNR